MEQTALPRILTPQEVSDYLKVSPETINEELRAGKLRGFKVGPEWRVSEIDLITYISQPTAEYSTSEAAVGSNRDSRQKGNFTEISPFDFSWPTSKGNSSVEHYDTGFETIRNLDGRNHVFRIGFTNREAAGMMRRRATVWIDKRPIVEFAGSNQYEDDGQMAAVIRTPNGRQLSPNDKVPNEYREFKIARYCNVVDGPRASANMAVVANKDDLESMIRHAAIRAAWKHLV